LNPAAKRTTGNERGVAAVELAIIIPILLILAFGVVDFGRLVQARLIVTNTAREGGSLASRGIAAGADLLDLLQSSADPLAIADQGRIYITKIRAGATAGAPNPVIASRNDRGTLGIDPVIRGNIGDAPAGLSPALYNHLTFNPDPGVMTSALTEITVVEVYYKYNPITPLPHLHLLFNSIPQILPDDGVIIGCKAVF